MASAEESPPQSQYDQEEKKKCRKQLIGNAVKALTTERDTSACVPRDHVRKAWQQLRETKETSAFSEQEVAEIEEEITYWERLHDSKVQTKKPSDLRVCYLAGDNPLNDFNVFLENGVLPQNMWAIEKDSKTLEKALENLNQSQKTPHMFKGNFLDFLRDSQCDKFDIIYFDACGSLPSPKQETLKAIGYVFFYSRLTSPGALITTFSFPPKKTEEAASNASSQDNERKHLSELAREYLKYRLVNTASQSSSSRHKIPHFNEEFLKERTDEENYSEYVVHQIIDTAYMYIPAHRMLSPKRNSLLAQTFVKKGDLKKAIEELLPQVTVEADSKSQSLKEELNKLESSIEGTTKNVELMQLPIKNQIDVVQDLSTILYKFYTLFGTTSDIDGIVQNVKEILQREQSELDFLKKQEKSKIDSLNEMEKEKERKIQELSVHEAQPPRNLGQLGRHLQSPSTINPLCKIWASEVFPDWKSDDLKKWEISQLLMVHLLTNWIAFIDKCSNKDFKDCQGTILKSLGADGDEEDSIFSQFVDVPNEEVTTRMIATLLYGQTACPSFPVLEKLQRLQYTAKKRQMFSNLFIFDRCQYVYDQFVSVPSATTVAKPHQQMVFRLAVDGLRKHLQHICEEDVFKCCNVVEEGVYKKVPVIPETSEITQQSHVEDLTSQDDVQGGEDDDQIREFARDSL